MRDSILGQVFAMCTDEEQAAFLNSAGREARRMWRDTELCGYDMQVSRIVDHLDGDGRELVRRLADCIRSDEDAPRVVKRIVYEDVIEPRPIEADPAAEAEAHAARGN